MRRGRLLLLLLLAAVAGTPLVSANAADEIQWSEDIEGSLREAAEAGRPVLLEFTASWCVYCKRMEKTTFTNDAVVARISRGFVPVRVDADKHKDLVQELGIKGLPAILIVSPELQIIERISGFQTAEALVAKLDHAAANPGQPTADAVVTADAGRTRSRQPAAVRDDSSFEFQPVTTEAAPQSAQPRVRPVSQPVTAAQPDFSGFEQSLQQSRASASMPAADTAERDQFDESAADHQASAPPKARQSAPAAAFAGQCLVSAVDDRELQAGLARFKVEYHDKVLYFRSAEYRQKFLETPEQYWPALDGHCAITFLNDDRQIEGQLQYAAVFRKQVWLFSSERMMKDFLLDPAEVAEEIADRLAE